MALNGKEIHDNVKVLSRSSFAIREDEALFMSGEKEGSEIYNMNKADWGAEIEFRTLSGGYLITNSPRNNPWNENSKGLMLREGKLIYRNGSEFFNVQEKDLAPLNDGEWKNILLSCEGGKVNVYIDGKYVNQIDNRGSTLLEGHVLRIGQGPNIYRLGASDLPIPFRGEAFDGEIRKVRFFKQALSKSEVSELFNGNKTPT